ncbi:hypothetical protein [Fimbriiglobus ruber]|uniref:EF-hand domain-containing protein n=1 Tax=Fimbriiglobus ruber TaxID=1908690 RepID=A0A225D0F9_9BACT|nr:hypothetical protein [Fimbriiglobus ruber]OWK34992.1 hypothetical protein FRUB_09834 [Fimbriiglobus ruber]
MKRLLAAIPIALAATLNATPPTESRPAAEFLVVSTDRLSVLALAAEVNRRPFADKWSEAVAAIFADADVDGNGSLDEQEAKRVLSALRVRQLDWGYQWAVPQAAAWGELDTAPSDGKVTREELAAYYHRQMIDAPQIGAAQAVPGSVLTDALLKHLDANHDGQVSEAEWKRADVALSALDQDDDELIRPTELVARTMYPGSVGSAMLLPPTTSQTLPKLLADFPLVRLPANLKEPVPLPAHTTRFTADTNGDGVLSDTELTLLRKSVGNASITFQLGDRKPGDDDATQTPGGPTGIRFVTYTVPSTLIDDFTAGRKAALERFAAADADGDGFLDAAEVKNAGNAHLRDHFAFADRNGNHRLARSEWEAYLALRSHLVGAQVTVTIFDHGRGLFEVLDADGDGALSVRELRIAWARLTALGCAPGGHFEASKLPRTVRIVASRGRPQSLLRILPRVGPVWFQAMDRNRDGDVSRREFVGSDDAFRKLDADHDGLISSDEAVAK